MDFPDFPSCAPCRGADEGPRKRAEEAHAGHLDDHEPAAEAPARRRRCPGAAIP
jgi:hypothetical protein